MVASVNDPYVSGQPNIPHPCKRGKSKQTDVPSLGRHPSLDDNVSMVKFLLWLVLLVLCWPLALLALVLWPIVWLLSLPLRLVGVALDGVFAFLRALLMLPSRLLGGPR
jgi:hypothetical protein